MKNTTRTPIRAAMAFAMLAAAAIAGAAAPHPGTQPAAAAVYYRATGWIECPAWYWCSAYAACTYTVDRVVGGGIQTDNPQDMTYMVQSLPVDNWYWYGQIVNNKPATVRYQTYATCLSGVEAAQGVKAARAPRTPARAPETSPLPLQ